MTSEVPIAAPDGPRFEISPHQCFACGTLNTTGMGLVLHVEAGRSWVDLTLEPRFQGWDGIAHGGILCTILDEVMAWALVGQDSMGVTARLQVDFKRPVTVGRALHAEGWVTRSRRRIFDTAGHILDATDDRVLATAAGVYMAVDEGRKRELRARYGWATADDAPGSVDRPA